MLEKAGFTARIGTEHLFVTVHDAVIHAVGIHSEVSLSILEFEGQSCMHIWTKWYVLFVVWFGKITYGLPSFTP